MTVFSFILAHTVQLSTECLTSLASIFLVGIIEDVKGNVAFTMIC
jgi:hypothetical protein